MFLGYAQNFKAYRLLDLESNVIVESIHVEFLENKFMHDSTIDEPIEYGSNVHDSNGHKSDHLDLTPIISSEKRKERDELTKLRSQRVRKEKYLNSNFIFLVSIIFLVKGDRTKLFNKTSILLNVKNDPKTVRKAISSKDATFWKEVIMNDEKDSILLYNT